MKARAVDWTVAVAVGLFVLALAVLTQRDEGAAVEPAGTHLMVNGKPLATTMPEAAGAPISVTEGYATAQVEGGWDIGQPWNRMEFDSVYARLEGKTITLNLSGQGGVLIVVDGKERALLSIGAGYVEVREP